MKTKTFILCEDIRHELGNKYSLIGLVGDEVEFTETTEGDYQLRLAIFVEAVCEPGDASPTEFRAQVAPEHGETASAMILLDTWETARKKVRFVAAPFPFAFEKAGDLVVSCQVYAKDELIWSDSRTVTVGIGTSN